MSSANGQIESVTECGDLVTDIRVSDLTVAFGDDQVRVECDGHTTQGIYESTEGQAPMTLIAFQNDAGFIQISITEGDASGFLGIPVGTNVKISW